MAPIARSRSARFAAGLGGLMLILAACGGGGDDSADDVDVATSAEAPADPAESVADDAAASGAMTGEVPGILQFAAPLVGGGEIDAAELSGKPTAFWFWSPT